MSASDDPTRGSRSRSVAITWAVCIRARATSESWYGAGGRASPARAPSSSIAVRPRKIHPPAAATREQYTPPLSITPATARFAPADEATPLPSHGERAERREHVRDVRDRLGMPEAIAQG